MRGKFDRSQVLRVPEATLEFVESETEDEERSEATDDDNDDDDHDDDDDAPPADPRPLNPQGHRYKVGDTLQFDRGWFAGNLGGLENNPVDRVGVVERTYRLQQGNRPFVYSIRFQPENQVVDRLPRADIDTDDEVSFVN